MDTLRYQTDSNTANIKYAEKNYAEADYHDADSEEADIVDIDEDISCLEKDSNSHSSSHSTPHSNAHSYQNTSETNYKNPQEVDSVALKYIENIDKPREKLLARGAKALELEELIAVIIGKGSVGNDALKIGKLIAKALLTYTYEITIRDLLYIPGMGEAKACQILAALELARRFPPPNQRKAKVMHPSDVLPFVTQYRYDPQENFIVISLTGAHEVINIRHITKGILDHCQIHPREVFAGAIEDRASSIVLVHNHPSGRLEPSKQDLLLTESMKRCGELLGVHVLDHIIIGPLDDYYCV